jgi:hypothetical protein
MKYSFQKYHCNTENSKIDYSVSTLDYDVSYVDIPSVFRIDKIIKFLGAICKLVSTRISEH